MKSRKIKVDYLARVEGEGGLYIGIKGNKVEETRLDIFEPPRFFEAFLRGRKFTEAPDITARICGICPVAYQMSACQAMEMACGVSVDGPLRDLRRLLYLGEWIESHVLHIYMLHAPDFLGYQDVVEMAKDYPPAVERALTMKKIGNDLVTLIGGREIHPINVKVGGFYKLPTKADLESITERLKWALEAAQETIRLTAEFPFPDYERDYEFVALRHPAEYPINEGRIVSTKGINISTDQFLNHVEEEHVPHSTSLHSVVKERGAYLVGPLARFNLNFDRLPSIAQEAAIAAGVAGECRNPFKSIIVRGIEILLACHEALEIIADYRPPESPAVKVRPRQAVGYGCTEAPRGILFHRYEIDDRGIIQNARIIPPTAQNQRAIEEDLRHFAQANLDLPDEKLTWQCEQMIRNYDPCISCSCHFLKLKRERM